jgi:hypothetical protein
VYCLAERVQLRLPESHSLKAKRAVLRPVLDRVRNRHVSISEVDHQDSWQLSALGIAIVAPTERRAVEEMDAIDRIVWGQPGLDVLEVERRWVEFESP